MAVYIILTMATVAAAFFVRNEGKGAPLWAGSGTSVTRRQMISRISLCGIFVLLFLVSACRRYVGNDYTRYQEFFRRLTNKNSDGVPTEIGFNAVVRAFQIVMGKDVELPIFAFFAFVTILLFLKAIYDMSGDFPFAFFLYMTFGYYFNSMNTVRYYMALGLVFLSMKYVLRKQYGKFVLLVLSAAAFHKSALVVLPVYLVAACVWKKWQIAAVSAAALSGFLFSDFYLQLIIRIYPTYQNTAYLEGGTSFINILRSLAILAFGILFCRDTLKENSRARFWFQLNYLGLLLYLCGSFIPEVSRIGYYMNVGQILLLPELIAGMGDRRKRKWAAVLVAAAACLYFAAFLWKADDSLIKLLPYRTWMFHSG